MHISRTGDLWWKNAVFYCLDVETFQDSNADGFGDFVGLTQRLDYLSTLGITCIWLMPFYPSPSRDDGYDITDYYGVDPRLGTLGDFVEFVRTARDRGIRVIADLVVNHTSIQHPWFQAARADRASPFRDWYVWSDEIPKDGPTDLVFPDAEQSNWAWDEAAGAYYLHRFYEHQPDLNVANPRVRDEICKVVGFWLELGLDGFRIDAVPFLLETHGTAATSDFVPHDWMRELRSFIGRRRGDAVLLGEVNLSYEETRRFFGDEADELHMCLNFNLNQAMALSLARRDTGPLAHSLAAMPALPDSAGWANFVRNHDEWSLDKLTEAERQEVFKAFGPEPEMQLFGRGLRRRLPTMLNGNAARLRLAYSLSFALPGAPVLFYGEEIGMAENLAIPGRMSVRAPMQWSKGLNGGFSSAPTEGLRRPLVEGRKWGPAAINVEDQERDEGSILKYMERLIRKRRSIPEIAFGKPSVLRIPQAAVLGIRYDWDQSAVIALHNLSDKETEVTCSLGIAGQQGKVTDLLGNAEFTVNRECLLSARMAGYSSCWMRLEQ